MIGGAIADDDQLVLGPCGSERRRTSTCACRWRGHKARAALGLRCRDKGRRTRACPTDAARARRSSSAGRVPTSYSRDRHSGGCALRPGRSVDGAHAGLSPIDPGSALRRSAGAPDRLGRAAFWLSSRTTSGDARRRGSSPYSRSVDLLTDPADQTAQRPARRWIGTGYGRGCGGALGVGLSRQGRLRSPGKRGWPPVR